MASQENWIFPWRPGVWEAALKAFDAGWKPPASRFPVLISKEGPLDTAEKLQKLLDLPSTPELSKTSVTGRGGRYDGEKKEVEIAVITWHQLMLLHERTEREEDILVWFPRRDTDTEELIPRSTCVVKSIKEEFQDTKTGAGEKGQQGEETNEKTAVPPRGE